VLGASAIHLSIEAMLCRECGCYIGSFLTLEDGDLLMTGTPKGVGPVNPGDRYLGRIFENDRLIVEGSWIVR